MNARLAARATLAERNVEAKLAGALGLWEEWQAGRLGLEEDPGPALDTPGPGPYTPLTLPTISPV